MECVPACYRVANPNMSTVQWQALVPPGTRFADFKIEWIAGFAVAMLRQTYEETFVDNVSRAYRYAVMRKSAVSELSLPIV